MGDRGNIVVKAGEGEEVCFYAHWRGRELPAVLQTALRRKERWEDASYLARIIFCEMVKGYEHEATGFGISSTLADNEHVVLVVDVPAQRVVLRDEDGGEFGGFGFREFCALGEKAIEDIAEM